MLSAIGACVNHDIRLCGFEKQIFKIKFSQLKKFRLLHIHTVVAYSKVHDANANTVQVVND